MRAKGITFGLVLSVLAPATIAAAATRAPMPQPGARLLGARPAPQAAPTPRTLARPAPPGLDPAIRREIERHRARARPARAQRLRGRYVPIYRPAAPVLRLRSGARPAIVTRLKVREPVVFVTIDDGYHVDSRVAEMVRDGPLPVTTFLLTDAWSRHKEFYRWFARRGATVQNHTRTHPNLRRLSLPAQKREICGASTQHARTFGARPYLFRPPYGLYDERTLRAVRECGLGAVVMWSSEFQNGRLIGTLKPGDIVLLHFRRELYSELRTLMRMLRARGLGVGLLEDYIAPA